MTRESPAAGGAPIAIVGIGCRFPGGIADADSYWRALVDGVDAITPIPPSRIDVGRYFDASPAVPGRMMTRWGGFIERIEDFDAAFFGISPLEAERLDPQQRLLLETAWEALEDAGQDVKQLEGTRTSVFIGQWISDFESRMFADPERVDFYMTTGAGRYAASGRLSYVLGLRGPSVTLDTACSSSLAAVHLAVQSIRTGESPLALAGGVNIILQPHITIAYSQSRMMAPDGRCKFGDVSGDGYVRSEGAGVVVLKALDRARADGDRIYAVIRGSAVNNDGRSSGSIGTPSRIGQEELLRTAYRDAGMAPGCVRYIEAHGTGTRAGDHVELGALSTVLSEGRAPNDGAYIGSVKSNFGHTEGAAGIAGLIKTALVLHHHEIPPSLHCRELIPAVPWDDVPLRIPTARTPWPGGRGACVAGVSAFGIAGTNAHVVLEAADHPVIPREQPSPRPASLLVLSARSVQALRATAARFAELLEASDGPSLQDVCRSAATRRTALEYRAAFVAESRAQMVASLLAYANGGPADADGVVYADDRQKIAFVLPGQGAQWVGMARELMSREPVFRNALVECDSACRPYADWSIVAQLLAEPGSTAYHLDRIDVIQPVLVALGIAYAALWRSLGVEPDAVVGHSMGEVAAACVAGVINLPEAMRVICRRSALMRGAAGHGTMALVELSMEDARAHLRGREQQLSVAASNSPRSSIISGDPIAVQEVLASLTADGVFCRLVQVDVASHSPQMDPLAAGLAKELAGLEPAAARIPIYSTVLGRDARGDEFGAAYWAKNLRLPVLFTDAVSHMLRDGVGIFVELGPHPILLPSVEQTARSLERPVVPLACGRRDEPQQAGLLAALGGLWCAGRLVDWSRLFPADAPWCRLPFYPWQRERHWAEEAEIAPSSLRESAVSPKPNDESLGWLHRLEWRARDVTPGARPPGQSDAGCLVIGASDADASAMAAALAAEGVPTQTASLHDLAGGVAKALLTDAGAPRTIVVLAPENVDAPYLPLRTLQAVLGVAASRRPQLWFVTRGSQAVASARAHRIAVDSAALWGAARVVAEEHPELWGGLVDMDPLAPPSSDFALLARHMLAADGEDQVAFRGGHRFVLRLTTTQQRERAAPYAWRADSTYLVTGGLGDVGLRVAEAMVRSGVRRLILLGRTALPAREDWTNLDPSSVPGRRVAAVRSLEAQGVAVHTAAVDVGDEAQLNAFLAQFTAEAWPPIRGIVHTAGTLDNHLAGTMSRGTFDALVRTKLGGARLLDRLLPDVELFVMFSSTGALLAQPGQANYAAANAGLDALAHDRRARGIPANSIEWGVWEQTGLVVGEAGERGVAELARQGVRAFSPESGVALFRWLGGGSEAVPVVLPIDWSVFRRARAGREFPVFRECMAGAGGGATGEFDLRQQLERSSYGERRQLLDTAVREHVGRVLKIAPARLDSRRALGSLGLNSLMAMELRNRLEAALGRSLSATLAWNYPTIEALAAYLAGAPDSAAQAAPATSSPAQGDLASRLSHVADLTDDDAVLALRARRPPPGS